MNCEHRKYLRNFIKLSYWRESRVFVILDAQDGMQIWKHQHFWILNIDYETNNQWNILAL